ncbi:Putative type II restriction endonuclease (fragment) [Magnetospirillum sp. UT-4]
MLQPLGRFFQVTETLDFNKYFLDFDKVNRFPLSFVIKIDQTKEDAITRIKSDAEKSNRFAAGKLESYMSLFENVYTLRDLREVAHKIPETALERIKSKLTLQFKLEFGLLD